MAPFPPAVARRLDEASAARLTKILGLLGSSHPGERATAAAKADALVKACGVTWRDIIMSSPSTVPQQLEAPQNWRQMAFECHARRAWLKPHERDFIGKLLSWRGEPSEKQTAWLQGIHARLLEEGTA